MKTTLFLAALLGAGLAALPAPAQQPLPSVPRPPQPVVGQPRPPQPPQPQIQPPRPPQPVVVQPRPPRPPQPQIQPPRPPQPQIQPPRPPQPVIQPPRPSYSEWLPVVTLAVQRPVGQVGAVLDGAYHNFRYLKLRVRNMPLTLDHLLVSYDYGPASSVPLRYRLRPGQDSAPLNLQRLGGRRIRRLDLWYSSSGNLFNPAVVTVLGLR